MIYKVITQDQINSTRESLYESIPLTGTIVSGTYGTYPNDTNVLKYTASHGLFETVYDYVYASSSANHIFDITFGYREAGTITPVTQSAQKYRMYKQMAQTLLGFDATGSVKDFVVSGSTSTDSMLFLNYSRMLTKDGIKIGSYTSSMGTASYATPFAGTLAQISDNPSLLASTVKTDSPVGQYWYLYTGSSFTEADKVGMIFYQQGVVALDIGKTPFANLAYSSSIDGYLSGSNLHSTGTITEVADGFRRYVANISFQNTVQINSTIYNCQVGLNEFNYSSNQTYTTGSSIRVKQDVTDNSRTYITTVGLYSEDNQLLAVAKVSEPLSKTPSDTINLRVRLDY